jgi:hypothetical protein
MVMVDDELINACMIWMYLHENLKDDDFGVYIFLCLYIWCIYMFIFIY